MKFNINSKELLALHNLLHERFNVHDGVVFKKDDPAAADDAQLRQVFNRLRACIIASLTNKQVDPLDAFLTKEQAKIDRLKGQNEDLKKEAEDLATVDTDYFVPKDDDDLSVPTDYPRRGPRNRNGNRGGNKR